MKILLLCSGNICRSPMAEAVLKTRLAERGPEGIEASSAGTLGIEDEPADPGAVEAAGASGYDLAGHRSRGLTRAMIDESGIVLCMELLHVAEVDQIAADRRGVHLLGAFAPPGEPGVHFDEIRDPLGGGAEEFRACLVLIERCVDGFLAALRAGAVEAEETRGATAAEGESDETRYFARIAGQVQAARGGQPLLTSAEFDIADRWWREGIPLWLVLEAIEATAALWAPGDAPRGFLARCEEEVDRRRRHLLP